MAPLLLAGLACGRSPAPAGGPAQTALDLFALGRQDDPAWSELERLVDVEPRADAALWDALGFLGGFPEPHGFEVHELGSPDEALVELRVELAGGGTAGFEVHLRRSAPDRWRITGFCGPGVEWPAARRRAGGDALTTSPAP